MYVKKNWQLLKIDILFNELKIAFLSIDLILAFELNKLQ